MNLVNFVLDLGKFPLKPRGEKGPLSLRCPGFFSGIHQSPARLSPALAAMGLPSLPFLWPEEMLFPA